MKSVLISIKPQWCKKIASGEKTIEVRKSAPKEVPFKAYIYCAKIPDKKHRSSKFNIGRLKAENARFAIKMKNVLEIEKGNAVKEFAEKLKKCSYCDNVFMDGKWHRYVFVDDIDKLLKEYEK